MNHIELFQHMEWADASVWNAVIASPQAREDGELNERLHHIHLVQRAFLQVWRKEEPRHAALDEFETANDMLAWAQGAHSEMMSFLRDSKTSDLKDLLASDED